MKSMVVPPYRWIPICPMNVEFLISPGTNAAQQDDRLRELYTNGRANKAFFTSQAKNNHFAIPVDRTLELR